MGGIFCPLDSRSNANLGAQAIDSKAGVFSHRDAIDHVKIIDGIGASQQSEDAFDV
jgi:hypothetical protein